jgi:exosortase/archaeosortase family protein
MRKKEKREVKKIVGLVLRYFLTIFFGFFIPLFYAIFGLATRFFLKLFLKDSLIVENLLIVKNLTIEIIPACIGGSAYYLLLALNLLTPMKIKKRILFIILSFLLFFSFNLFRLLFLIFLELKGIQTYFYHKALWYFGSTIFVFFTWFICIKIFKIKEIPVVTDFFVLKRIIQTKQLNLQPLFLPSLPSSLP